MDDRMAAHNRGFAIVGLTNKGSTFVFQFSFCARVGLTEFYCPTIAKPCSLAVTLLNDRAKIQQTDK